MRVAVTGVAGTVGRRVVQELAGSPGVDRLLGLDLVDPFGRLPPAVELVRVDVRARDVARHLEGVDVLVHLAGAPNPARDEAATWSVNVDGTRNVVVAAHAAGARKIVFASSAAVYGAHADNDFPLTEDSPLRANPGFSYAGQKQAAERWLWSWAAEQPDVTVTVLRLAIVAGRGIDNFITRQLEFPRLVVIRGYTPPWQVAHVDDVATAVALAVHERLPGAYNVACEGWLSFHEATQLAAKNVVALPEEVAFQLAARTWDLGLGEAPAGQLHYLKHPIVMSVDRLLAAGWRPRHTNRDAVAELAADHAGHVTIAGVRARKRDLRLGAGLLGVVVGLLAARQVRRGPRGDLSD